MANKVSQKSNELKKKDEMMIKYTKPAPVLGMDILDLPIYLYLIFTIWFEE